ncbi:MAG TPA: flagellar motor switch protein FliM [candidate division Zixibacteria bacterium]|nr:flagellar motor switch protein FliM [candidate division Zixibacteria bacterium]
MAQVLSQEEIDALLSGVAKQQPATVASESGLKRAPASPDSPDYKPYDFTRSEASARGRLPGLEVIFSDFARRLRSIVVTELGKSVDVAFDGMEVVSYEHLIQSFPLPASMHAVRLDPLRGVGLWVIEARLAFAMVELFFGGSGQKTTKVEGRDFTLIENRFLGKFVERMLRGMEESWQSVAPLKGRYLRSEVNPYLLNAASMGDAMILATYNINMSPVSGAVLFSLPLAAIEELRGQLKSVVPIADDPDSMGLFQRLLQPLMDVDVEVKAVVDVIEMSVGEIMGLRPGDVLQLGARGLDQVELWIEGKRKFLGRGAQRNGNKVVVVTGPTRKAGPARKDR